MENLVGGEWVTWPVRTTSTCSFSSDCENFQNGKLGQANLTETFSTETVASALFSVNAR